APNHQGAPFWSDFPGDARYGIRADVSADKIELHLRDGRAGDLDGRRDGVVTVLGGVPRFGASGPLANNLINEFEHHEIPSAPITGQVAGSGNTDHFAKVLGSEVGGSVDFDPVTRSFAFRHDGTMVSTSQGAARGGFVFQLAEVGGATAFGSVVI